MTQDDSWESFLHVAEESGQQVAELLRLKFRDTPSVEQNDQWRREMQLLADRIPPQHLTHHLVRRLEKHRIRIGQGLSFHRFMIEDSEIRKMRLKSLSWELNSKTKAYRFADAIGVRRPQSDIIPSSFDDISLQFPGVLKATVSTGGRGIYILHAEDEIVHVADKKQFSSVDKMSRHARGLMSARNRRPLANKWITEELVLEDVAMRVPARDVKFFSFYGEVVFVLEVIRTEKQPRYSFTLPDGTPIRPKVNDYVYFDGAGASADDLNLASSISQKIPHPFMRIDMLKGDSGLVFGEFTPRPGGFHQYTPEWDRRMGEAWARAEGRIQRDLLSGKRFDEFLSTGVYRER